MNFQCACSQLHELHDLISICVSLTKINPTFSLGQCVFTLATSKYEKKFTNEFPKSEADKVYDQLKQSDTETMNNCSSKFKDDIFEKIEKVTLNAKACVDSKISAIHGGQIHKLPRPPRPPRIVSASYGHSSTRVSGISQK